MALLGVCRYLTARQLVELGTGARTEKSATYKLRGLAGEATRAKVRAFEPALLKALAFRAFDGQPFQLWALTPAGYALAGSELGRLLKVPRVDVGAAFAEHSVFLTDLLVTLARPLAKNGLAPRDFPFRWDVVEDVELPWREKADARNEKARVIRPDAVLEIPAAKRRIFIECEMGTHTLTPESPEKLQATVRKVERYDAYVRGFADPRAQVSHYQRKYPDAWPCEVVFLVQTEARERRTNKALACAGPVPLLRRFASPCWPVRRRRPLPLGLHPIGSSLPLQWRWATTSKRPVGMEASSRSKSTAETSLDRPSNCTSAGALFGALQALAKLRKSRLPATTREAWLEALRSHAT